MKYHYSKNELMIIVHQDSAYALRDIADFIEKNDLPISEAIKLMREMAELKEAEAQSLQLQEDMGLKRMKD